MFIILKNTLFGLSLITRKRGTVGLDMTSVLRFGKRFDTKEEAENFMQGHNSENKVIIVSIEEYKNKIDR